LLVKKLKSQNGTVMIETVLSCLLLIVFFFGFIELFHVIQSDIYVQRIAREGAREASLTGDTAIGRAKAEELVRQYFGTANAARIDMEVTQDSAVICTATYKYKPFKMLSQNGYKREVILNGQAVFPWWDRAGE